MDRPSITRRGLAALAACAAGVSGRARAAQEPAAGPPKPEERLRRAAARLARWHVPRDTQPAIQFQP